MFKEIVYINPLILFVIALIIRSRISVNFKYCNKKNLKICLIICIIYLIINTFLSYLAHWNNGHVGFIIFSLVLLIFTVLITINSFKLVKKLSSINDTEKINIPKLLIVIIFPIINFVLPYFYEFYLMKNCDYIFIDETINGLIGSSDYSVLINNKIKNFSLAKFEDKTQIPYKAEYQVEYKDNGETEIKKLGESDINDEIIKTIASDAKKRTDEKDLKKEYNVDSKIANIKFLPNTNYVIISLSTKIDNGVTLGSYLYNENSFVLKLKKVPGNVIYYNKK